MAARWGIDVEAARRNAQTAAAGPDLGALWAQVYHRPGAAEETDVDEDLYGGFVGKDDRRLLDTMRREPPAKLAMMTPPFDDQRLGELVFRYRARNFPQTLSEQEAEHWEAHRAARLFDGAAGARTVEQLFGEIDQLSETADERGEEILGALYDYAEMVAPQRY
jgi:exodeoxyribonuclease-1